MQLVPGHRRLSTLARRHRDVPGRWQEGIRDLDYSSDSKVQVSPVNVPEAPTECVVSTGVRGSILVVTINRPEARNAINAAVAEAIGDALELARHDPGIRVVVLTGAGDVAFSGGGDLKAMAAGQSLEPMDPEKAAWGFGGIAEHPIDKPIVAAVNGLAIGGGAEIALACDLVVADEDAQFSLPEVRNGFLASGGGIVWLSQWVPRAIAMEILLIGGRFSAAQAKEWGLVNRVVPHGQALAVALRLAEEIAANAPLAVQATKRLVAGVVDSRFAALEEAWRRNHLEKENINETEDAREGPRAFLERRPAAWKGR